MAANMDALLSEEQRLHRDTVRTFVQSHIAPHAAQWDRDRDLSDDVVRQMGEMGLLGMAVPAEWGGTRSDDLTYAMAIEEVAAGCGSCAVLMSVHNSVGCVPILTFGSEAQKQRWLPALAQGELLGAFCLTEPHSGSEAHALRTRAELKDGHWVLNGQKQFVSNGERADVAIVFAITDPALGKRGISAFVVPTDTPGFNVGARERKMGLRASDTCAIALDDCRIPENHLLGERGQGLKIALSNLEGGRIGIAAQAVGIARAALVEAQAYAQERVQFGKPIAEHQAIAHMLADMLTQLNAARLLVHHAARLRTAGQPCASEASQAKLFASEMAEWVCSKAIQVLGGYGYLEDHAVERHYRDARVTQIYEGTSEIQRTVIARHG